MRREFMVEWPSHGLVAVKEGTNGQERDCYHVIGVLGLRSVTPIALKDQRSFRRYLQAYRTDMNHDPRPLIIFSQEPLNYRPIAFPLTFREEELLYNEFNRRPVALAVKKPKRKKILGLF